MIHVDDDSLSFVAGVVLSELDFSFGNFSLHDELDSLLGSLYSNGLADLLKLSNDSGKLGGRQSDLVAVHGVWNLKGVLVLDGETQKELAESLVFGRLEFDQQLRRVFVALKGNGVVEVGALEDLVQTLKLDSQRVVL